MFDLQFETHQKSTLINMVENKKGIVAKETTDLLQKLHKTKLSHTDYNFSHLKNNIKFYEMK